METAKGRKKHSKTHSSILLPLNKSSPVSLDLDGTRSKFQVPFPVIPSFDHTLKCEDVFGQNSVPFLFQEQVMSILEEDLRLPQLVIDSSSKPRQDFSTDLSRRSSEVCGFE